jgi:predicted Zn-dependent peptidase
VRQIADDIDRLGVLLNTSVAPDWLSISATALTEDVPVLFNLLSDLVLHPSYSEHEIEAARTRALSEVRAAVAAPSVLADRYFLRELYGEAHPYGAAPSAASITAIDSESVRAFHRANFVPRNALLLVAGDVDAAQVEVLARNDFGGWKGDGKPLVRLPEPTPKRSRGIMLIHQPGVAQSSIRVGGLTVGPEHPDYPAIRVFARVLCRGGAGRLSSALNEKGWTYGLECTTSETRGTQHLSIAFPTRPEATASALALVLNVLKSMSEQLLAAEEVNAAIDAVAGSYPLARLQTPADLGAEIARTRMLDLPLEHVFGFRERIRAVTRDDVKRVGQQYLPPERLQVVVVGDAAKLIDNLEKIGPVSLFDTAGRPLNRSKL